MGAHETKLLDQAPFLPIPEDNYTKENFYIKENINIFFLFFTFSIFLIIFIIFLNNKKSKWR